MGWNPSVLVRSAGVPVAVLALSCLVFLLPGVPAWAEAGGEEAIRQARFARQELADGEYERALKSAESALTLAPALHEALLLKALAYEGLGEHGIARSLLLAHRAATGSWPPGSEPHEAMVRVEAAMERGSVQSSDRLTLLDPGPIRERVEQAVTAGRCVDAEASAEELVRAAPEDADSWRLRGDAARCGNETREALLAYRRYRTSGGSDEGVLRLIDDLSAGLARVRVEVALADGSPVPFLRIRSGAEELAPTYESDGTFLFVDLPLETAQTLVVAGKGLEAEEHQVPGLGSGQEHTVRVSPTFVGLGTVRLADYPPSVCEARLRTADEEVEAPSGATITVTAGEVTALVFSEEGVAEVPLEVAPDATVDFEPTAWLPAALTVVGLPAGARVQVYVEGAQGLGVDRTERVPPHGGEIDRETGVRVAPSFPIESLVGGRSGLFVSHPFLGDGAHEVVLSTGTLNATTFDWRGQEGMQAGIEEIRLRYEAWMATSGAVARKVRARTTGLAVASGVLAAAGAVLVIAGAAQSGELEFHRGKADAMLARGDDLTGVRADFDRVVARQTGLIAGGSVGLGLAGAGVVLTFGSSAQARKAADREPWEPWERPEVEGTAP